MLFNLERLLSTGILDVSDKNLDSEIPHEALYPDTSNSKVKWWEVVPLQVIKARNNSLQTINDLSSFADIRELIFSNNLINSIHPSLCNLPQLKLFDLSNNCLTSLPSSFSSLSSLVDLNLSHNKLTCFDCKCLENVVVLNLDGNNLTQISCELPSIRRISLNKNNLLNLNELILGQQLENFSCSDNILNQILDFRAFKNLKTLLLSFNNLNNSVFEYLPQNLIELHVNNNSITSLNFDFNYFKNLSILLISNNQISTLPSNFELLSNLTVLDLSNNNISRLHPSLAQIKGLRSLEVNGNPLRFPSLSTVRQGFRAIISSLSNQLPRQQSISVVDLGRQSIISEHITKLDLSDKGITSIPDISICNQLVEINLSNNSDLSWNFHDFLSCSSTLKILNGTETRCNSTENFGIFEIFDLNISKCNLLSLDFSIISSKFLKVLNISNNPKLGQFISDLSSINCENLEELDISFTNTFNCPVINSKYLRSINLSNNQISDLSCRIPVNLIEVINLENNDLSKLPLEFGQMPRLATLMVAGNPLKSIRPGIRNGASAILIKYLRQRI
ncbi:hypothetical protein RCL1_001809 [Eukaryota sp. TZLM3-RCL]